MSQYSVDSKELALLKGKSILVTGCSSGIGRAAAMSAYKNGANVILADWNEEQLNNLVIELKSATEPGNGRLTSRKTNVADWNDLVEVFEQGFNEFGAIDAVISNAGVNWGETLLQHEVDPVTKKLKPPSLEALNINLVGHIYAVNCATYYFEKQQRRPTQIVITASAAAFIDTPPLYLYSAAKAGLLGMMRSLRNDLPRRGTTINLVAPWMTMTPMTPGALKSAWGSLPSNDPEGVGHALLCPIVRPDLNGKSLFVAGNEITEFEDTITSSQPIWMGQRLSDSINEGQKLILSGRSFN